MSKPFNYGGQAVIEGVMMRGSRTVAIALRHPEGQIVVETEPLNETLYRVLKDNIRFPESEIRDGRIFMTSEYENSEILVYEREEVFKRSFLYREGGLSLGDVFSAVKDLSYDFIYYCYAFDEERDMGIVAGPYSP